MRVGSFSAIVTAAFLVAAAVADTPSDRVDRIVNRLGSDTFRDRETATRELDNLGAAALDALRRAAASSDPETRRRAADLIERITERLAAARMLAATTIEFDFKNKPLDEAVRDLVRRAGGADAPRGLASITLHDSSDTKFRGRTVTVATPGPMPFWEALELFCRKADLHEWDGFSRVQGLGNVQQTGDGFGRVQIQGQVIVRSGRGRPTMPAPMAIVLLDGPAPALPTCRNGAVRVRVLPPGIRIDGLAQTAADEVVLPLHVLAEPKLQWQGAAEVRIDRAVDERGKLLTASTAIRDTSNDDDDVIIFNPANGMIMQNPVRRSPVGVRIHRGDKQSTRLAELAGFVTAQVRVAEQLVVADAPLKLVGQTIRGAAGVSLKVNSAVRAENGEITVSVEIQLPQDVYMVGQAGNQAAMIVGGMIMQGGVVVRPGLPGAQAPAVPAGTTDYQGLALEDGKGRRFPVTRGMIEMNRFAPEGAVYTFNYITFKPTDATQEPARLIFTGTRPASLEVPFVVKDVPLQ